MPVTAEEVKQVIEREFPDSKAEDIREVNHRITGIIRWDGFAHKNTQERYQLISDRVRNSFGRRGLNVDVLFPLTSREKL